MKKLPQFTLLLAAFIAFSSAYTYWYSSKPLVFFYLIVGILNLLALTYIKRKQFTVNAGLNFINLVATVLTGYLFWQDGKNTIALLYVLAAAGFLFATIRFGLLAYRKEEVKA